MFKKMLSLLVITLMVVSCSGAVSATDAKISIDADWRLVHTFQFTDTSTQEVIWNKQVAAGNGHEFKFCSNEHKLHELCITVTPWGRTNPDYITKTVAVYQGGDITVESDLSYNAWHAWYDFKLSKCVVDGKNI
ncbi:MAG: hypothetical protein LBR15_00760 [Methanobrevibacter sp.]|nr:hypothetical protein [Candidatus Methanovirga australis]